MNDKNNEWMLSLLQIIRVNGNLEHLIGDEQNLAMLNKALRSLKIDGYIDDSEDYNLILTEKGIRYYHELCRKFGKKGIYRFLMPDRKNRRNPISIDYIYIPNKKGRRGLL